MTEIHEALKAPFPIQEIKWRVGATNQDKTKAIALAYIDARTVMDRLDEVVGAEKWEDNYHLQETPDGITTVCSLGVDYGNGLVFKSDGAGESNIEGAKGGISDAFKRAGVKHGIGRYLYNLPTVWVRLKDGKYLDTTPALPSWAVPEGEAPKTKPEEPKADRPYSAEDVQKAVTGAMVMAKTKGKRATSRRRNIAAAQLTELVGSDEMRHAVSEYLIGESSIKKMGSEMIIGLLVWMFGKNWERADFNTPISDIVIKEAQNVIEAVE